MQNPPRCPEESERDALRVDGGAQLKSARLSRVDADLLQEGFCDEERTSAPEGEDVEMGREKGILIENPNNLLEPITRHVSRGMTKEENLGWGVGRRLRGSWR